MAESEYEFLDKAIFGPEKSLDLGVGRILKTRIRVTPSRTQIGRTVLRNEDVVAVGWWSQTTKNIEWSQNEWTTGWIRLRTNSSKAKLTIPGPKDFRAITGSFWRYIVMPNLYDLARNLEMGRQFDLCGFEINGDGVSFPMALRKAKLVPWERVDFSVWDGKLSIRDSEDCHVRVSKSYRRVDNLPVLVGLLNGNLRRNSYDLSWTDAVWPVQ